MIIHCAHLQRQRRHLGFMKHTQPSWRFERRERIEASFFAFNAVRMHSVLLFDDDADADDVDATF